MPEIFEKREGGQLTKPECVKVRVEGRQSDWRSQESRVHEMLGRQRTFIILPFMKWEERR